MLLSFIVLNRAHLGKRTLSLPRLLCSVNVVLVVTFPPFCSDRVQLFLLTRIVSSCFYLPCWLAWSQRLKRTPHLVSEAVWPVTNLSTNIERNPTASDSVRWINTDQPNGSHSACTETMVPYQDGDRNFL